MVASDAVTGGNPVYGAASGKVAPTGTVVEGIALESVGANGDMIEVDVPNRRLDYLWFSPSFRRLEGRVVREAGTLSDHLPVVVELAF